jgi:uncharacterized cupredoxin-like copper-binding protein
VKPGLLAVGVAAILLMPGGSSPGPLTVDVTIHHSHFFPSHFSFPAGTEVRFVIHNTDPIDHEFIVGPQVLQYYMEHSTERAHHGSVPGQISVPAETVATTTYTARKGFPLLFGCHLPGHYSYGMRGTISVT